MHKSLQKVIETLKVHMEEGGLIWHNPCLIRAQSNAISGYAYQGINQFITAVVANTEGYQSPYWATFKQIQAVGGQLIEARGKGVPIIFYKRLPSRDSEDHEQERFVIRHSFVFNLDLVEGIEAVHPAQSESGSAEQVSSAEHIATHYLDREQISVSHGAPAYAPGKDRIYMPLVEEVVSTDEYYSTYFHELAHSTGHPQRLCRFGMEADRFESKEDYSKEELVAEITAAMLWAMVLGSQVNLVLALALGLAVYPLGLWLLHVIGDDERQILGALLPRDIANRFALIKPEIGD